MTLELTYLAHFLSLTRQRQGPPLPARDQLIITLITWASRRERHQTASGGLLLADSDAVGCFTSAFALR